MSDNQYLPDIVSMPGETLKETLDAYNLSVSDFAYQSKLSPRLIEDIVSGRAAITPEIAAKLEQALYIPARFWLTRERQYRDSLMYAEYIHQSSLILGRLRQHGNVTSEPVCEDLADQAHAVLEQHRQWLSDQKQKGGGMRKQLEKYKNTRQMYTGVFMSFGHKKLSHNRVMGFMLVQDVFRGQHFVAEHVWVQLKDFVSVPLLQGYVIQFSAEVYVYHKRKHRKGNYIYKEGDTTSQMEYGLCRPRDIKVLPQEQREEDEAS